ncbi:dihydroorotate dehydrogenase [Ascoidea rubescens DSM 1968]|uniref:Dihydroorotate dehydrogenase (quinone), mitochondrial n=1 Tax=Ascoidea rubescens DSM 1968 TaxID=1344418 RepID=A0A1D2VC61_9ASCO|nr:dihydroorotate dehydrogenase mitochondrial precursor [Ascoidea rubescens DSM 1968]ODV59221.1 dihydroorotate dehydrogenase mitochondrial precursor [Ascoidea rubescens DSM 1968]
MNSLLFKNSGFFRKNLTSSSLKSANDLLSLNQKRCFAKSFFKKESNSNPNPNIIKSSALPDSLVILGGVALASTLAYYLYDAKSSFQEYVTSPVIRLVTDGENGHKFGIFALKNGLCPRIVDDNDIDLLKVKNIFGGRTLSNPIGMAAGFDKNGEAIDPLFDLGFSYVEIGSITPEPQPGNPTPRVFRLPRDEAIINRYGFNSDGHWSVLTNLRLRLEKYYYQKNYHLSLESPYSNAFRDEKILAINLGKNKNGDEIEDYTLGVQRFGEYSDVLVINVSSPNTPGLRTLQSNEKLTNLLKAVKKERDNLSGTIIDKYHKPSLLVKIAPDLSEMEIKSIAESVKESKIDGIIVSNTTIQRPINSMRTDDVKLLKEQGGLSGKPIKELSLKALRTLRKYTKDDPSLILVGCGGISSGKDAIEFAKAGASFVEVLTSFAYRGPGLPYKIKSEIINELKKEGKTWMDIIGEDDK